MCIYKQLFLKRKGKKTTHTRFKKLNLYPFKDLKFKIFEYGVENNYINFTKLSSYFILSKKKTNKQS